MEVQGCGAALSCAKISLTARYGDAQKIHMVFPPAEANGRKDLSFTRRHKVGKRFNA
jgi:hypothetical protein